MKIYQGNSASRAVRRVCMENGYGIMLSEFRRDADKNFPYFAIDNGAFSAWKNNEEWNKDVFLRLLDYYDGVDPDFAVVPDKVADGEISLKFSLKWLEWLRRHYDMPFLLAVQDGMAVESVEQAITLFDGIFVGGTKRWKYRTAKQWVNLAHDYDKICHIGRCYSLRRVCWADRIGADSIDSTGWARNDTFNIIESAECQEVLPCTV